MYISKEKTKYWTAFTFKGKKFLALESTAFGSHVTIIGDDFSNYGSYRSIDDFKKYYELNGGCCSLGELT